jgi:arsenite methyltransferase
MYDETEIKAAVRERYAGAATQGTSCCGPDATTTATTPSVADAGGCGCGSAGPAVIGGPSERRALGYDAGELAELPDGADLGLGCGNPLAMLELREGETVLDLGSGGGIDCFLAAKRVGPTGHVIGVDMTPEMIDRARRNAAAGGYDNVEFRLGEVEHLPVADGSVDAIISNCVINLVPDKRQAFAEAFRVLAPGGRLSVSDIVTLGEVPPLVRDSVDAYVACLSGASLRDDYLGMLREAGFARVEVTSEQGFELEDVVSDDMVRQFIDSSAASEAELRAAAGLFQSVRVRASKEG